MRPLRRFRWIAAFLPLLVPSFLVGQQGTIRGQVVEREGLAPLANATVQVVDEETGALTDQQGRFSLQVPAGTHQIRVTLIGYETAVRSASVEAGDTEELTIRLNVSTLQLGEITVTTLAARETRREELGTDIESLNAQVAVDKGAVSSFSDLLNARATGVSIAASSGEAGTASKVRVRGQVSLTQSNTPLVYLDGIRVSNATGTGPGAIDFGDGPTISRLDDINPRDIASVEVIKGPTAAALYGAEAASGVLVLTTRSGSSGEPRFSLTAEQGFKNDHTEYPDNFYNLTANTGRTDLDAAELQQWRPVLNSATGDVFLRDNPLENPHTDPFGKGFTGDYNVSVRGGSEDVTYYGSGGFRTDGGVLPNNEAERVTARGNMQAELSDVLELSFNSGFVRNEVRYNGSGRSALGVMTNAMGGLPEFSFGTTPDGGAGDCMATVLSGLDESLCVGRQGNLTANFDKLASIENSQEVFRFIPSAQLRYSPADWLSNRLTMGLDYAQTRDRNLIPLDPDRPFGTESEGLIIDNRTTALITTLDYASTATASLSDDLSSSTTAGVQLFSSETELVGCEGNGFSAPNAIACDAALTFSGVSNRVEINEVGGFLQEQLNYRDYLFATGAIRLDDISSLGENEGLIISPSVNLSAVLSSMPFWNVEAINNLRLRFAFGTAAQSPAPFAAARTFRPVRLTDESGNELPGVSLLDPGNPDLKAEQNREFEAGFDAGFMDNRLALKVTYFDNTLTDGILSRRVAPSTGFSGPQFVNIGEVTNQGVEASLNALVTNRDDIRWDVTFQFSTQDSQITDLGGLAPILLGAQVDGMLHEGFAPGSYYGPLITDAERDDDGSIIPASVEFAAGNLDISGRPNYRFFGRPDPTNMQSLSTTVTLFDRLRFFTLFDRSAGHQKMDDTQGTRTPFIQGISGSRQFAMRQVESSPEIQAAMEMDIADGAQVFVHDADFIKWREVTLQYDLPERWLGSVLPVNRASVTLGARNLATITDYPGLDPELSVGGGRDDFTSGDFFEQPPPRAFWARLSLVF